MYCLKFIIFVSSVVSALGCASRAVQTEALLNSKFEVSKHHLIPDVPIVNQSAGYCGPATLTMAMQYRLVAVDIDQIATEVYTPGVEGSFPLDIISATRRHGLSGIAIEKMTSLITEVAVGNPVIIFENLSLSWAPQWHYALIVGYDLEKQEIIMHSGNSAYKKVDMKDFERSWKLADYWGLAVLPPNQLSETGSEYSHLKSAVGLEQANHFTEAKLAYKAILTRWPQSLVALIGLGNLSYVKKNKKEAIMWLKLAVKFHPESLAAKNNLKLAQNETRH